MTPRHPSSQGSFENRSLVHHRILPALLAAALWLTASGAARAQPLPSWARGAIVYGAALPLDGPHPLQGLTRRLPRIAALGVTVLWLSPVTGAPPGDFGYAVTDALHVRAALGTEADLRALVSRAHALGLHVILDMVVNHLSDRHPYAIDAHRNGAASPYYAWFERDDRGQVVHYFDWKHLDNLDYRDPDVDRYMIGVFMHWVRAAGIDGFRVDASWAVRDRDPEFWPRWRAALERIDPDLLTIAEGSATDPYYLEHGFDVVYDWSTKIGQWAWSGVFDSRASPDLARLRSALDDTRTPGRVLRFIDDNDTGARFITRHGLAETRLAATLLLTLPGLPLVYDGDEVGAEFQPYDERPIVRLDRYGLRALYERLGRLRRATSALRSDAIHLVATDRDDTVLAYLRTGRDPLSESQSSDGVLVLLNWADTAADVHIADPAALRVLGADDAAADLLSGTTVVLVREPTRVLRVHLPAHGALVLARRNSRIP